MFFYKNKAPGRAAPHRSLNWGCTETPIFNQIRYLTVGGGGPRAETVRNLTRCHKNTTTKRWLSRTPRRLDGHEMRTSSSHKLIRLWDDHLRHLGYPPKFYGVQDAILG